MIEPRSAAEVQVVYTVKELLGEINDRLGGIKALQERHDADIRNMREWQEGHQLTDAGYYAKVDKIVDELKVAQEVRDALNEQAERGFTRRQKLVAAATGVVVVLLQVWNSVPHHH